MDKNLLKFFILTIPLGWFWWIQILLGLWPNELILIPSSLGGLSPVFSVWLIDRFSDSDNLNKILSSVKEWQNVIPLLLLATILFPTQNIASKLASSALNIPVMILEPVTAELGLSLIIIIPITFFCGLATSPLLEEPAWRGYALPRLQVKYGVNVASLFLGSYWWLWHQMMNLAFGMKPTFLHYLSMLGQSFIIDSLYLSSKRVILVAMFAHQSLFIMLTYLADPMDLRSQIIYLAILWSTVFFLRQYPLEYYLE